MIPYLATLCLFSAGVSHAFEQTALTSAHLKVLEDGRLGTMQMIRGVPFAQPCFDDPAGAACAHIKQLYTDEGASCRNLIDNRLNEGCSDARRHVHGLYQHSMGDMSSLRRAMFARPHEP